MSQRERYIDIVKGFAILCIVFIHFENGVLPVEAEVFIGSFMISAFFVVSGWIDAKRDVEMTFRSLLMKRWRQLGKPYLLWSVIILAFDVILFLAGHFDGQYVVKELYKTIVLRGIGTLWFLPALMGGEIIWLLVKKRCGIIGRFVVLAIALIYANVYYFVWGAPADTISRIIDAPLKTVDNVLIGLIGIMAGYYMRRLYCKVEDKMSCLAHIFLGISLVVISYFDANYCLFPHLAVLGAPLIAPLGLLLVSRAVESSKLLDYLAFWGRHSLGLMVTHYSLVLVLCVMLYNATTGSHGQLLDGWMSIAFFVGAMVVEYFIVMFIEDRFPYLLGKEKK